jgi:GxxExxY protein
MGRATAGDSVWRSAREFPPMETPINADTSKRRVRECHEVLLEEALTHKVIGAFFHVYNALGYGFLEAVYARALEVELARRGLQVAREVSINIWYGGEIVGQYRADLLVENVVVVELKAHRVLVPPDRAQLLNCLRASNLEVGLVLNFGLRPAFLRVVSSNETTRPRRHSRESRNLSAPSACATDNAPGLTPLSDPE